MCSTGDCGCSGAGCTVLLGNTGTAGSVWRSGSGAPSGALGVVGDWYLDTVAPNNFYEKTATSTYTLRGSLQGDAGAAGTDGRVILYNNWTAVQNGATAGFVDLMSYPLAGTGALSLEDTGDEVEFEGRFTIVGATSSITSYIQLKVLFGSLSLLHTGIATLPIWAPATKYIVRATVTRISNTSVRYVLNTESTSSTGAQLYTAETFVVSSQVVPSLALGTTIKFQADGLAGNDVTQEHMKVTLNKIQ
jgi:hypothetical protein